MTLENYHVSLGTAFPVLTAAMAPDSSSQEKCWGRQQGPGAALLPLPCPGTCRRYLWPRHSGDQPHKYWGTQTTAHMGAYMQVYGVTYWSEVGLGTHTTFLSSADRDQPEALVAFPLTVTVRALCSLSPTSTSSPPVIPAHHLHPYISLVLFPHAVTPSKPWVPTQLTTVPGGQLQRSSLLPRASVASFKLMEGTCQDSNLLVRVSLLSMSPCGPILWLCTHTLGCLRLGSTVIALNYAPTL